MTTADSARTAGTAAMKASGPETKARRATCGRSKNNDVSISAKSGGIEGRTGEEEHEESDD